MALVPPDHMAIMAIDPGQHTGIAYVELKARRKRPVIRYAYAQVEVSDELDFYDKYRHLANDMQTTIAAFINSTFERGITYRAIVVEDFVLRGGAMLSDRDALGPVIFISMIYDFLSSIASSTCKVELQMPGMKETVTNRRLQTAFLYSQGCPHAMDALRHALVYARTRGYAGVLARREARPPNFWA